MSQPLRTSRVTRFFTPSSEFAVMAPLASALFVWALASPLRLGFWGGILGSITYLAVYLRFHGWKLARAPVIEALDVSERGVVASDDVVLSRDEIVQGYVEPSDHGALVRLTARSSARSLSILASDLREAHAIVDALGLDAKAARVTLYAPSQTSGLVIGMSVALVLVVFCVIAAVSKATGNLHSLGETLGTMLALPFLLMFPFALARPVRVIVGPDGVRIAPRLGRARHLPWTTLRGVESDERGIQFLLRSGGDVRLRYEGAKGAGLSSSWEGYRKAVVERVRERLTP